MLLDPTSVAFSSLPMALLCRATFTPTPELLPAPRAPVNPAPAPVAMRPPLVTPMTVVAAAGDCEGLGWKTTVPALGLPLVNWWMDCLLPGVAALRSCKGLVKVFKG